jgi:hypothetical protein
MSEAYRIEDGRITAPVKGATLIGNGPDALTKVRMIGNDSAMDPGIGTCGKNGQGVPVGVGQPTLRMGGLTVGAQGNPQKSLRDFPGAPFLALHSVALRRLARRSRRAARGVVPTLALVLMSCRPRHGRHHALTTESGMRRALTEAWRPRSKHRETAHARRRAGTYAVLAPASSARATVAASTGFSQRVTCR